MPDLTNITDLLDPVPYRYVTILVLALLLLLFALYRYRRTHKGIIPFEAEGGTIEMAPQTLRAVMENAAGRVSGVARASCRHFRRGQSLGVKVSLHIHANQRLRDIDSLVKNRIRATLLEQFGMASIDPIHIRVTRIVGDPLPTVPEDETIPANQPNTDPDLLSDEDPSTPSSDPRP